MSIPFLPKSEKDEYGIRYYLLSPDQKIYRGSPSFTMDSVFRAGEIYYFSPNAEAAEQYGVVFEFTPTIQHKLLALDDADTRKSLYDSSPLNIQTILRENYGYGKGDIRDSVFEKDNMLAKYLCQQGYDGYATNIMVTELGGNFHQEIVLCHPENTERRQITPESKRPAIIAEINSRKRKEEYRALKRNSGRSRLFDEETESIPLLSFGTESYSSPPKKAKIQPIFEESAFNSPPRLGNIFGASAFDSPPSKISFGGRKRRRTAKRRNRTKRRDKTQKRRKGKKH